MPQNKQVLLNNLKSFRENFTLSDRPNSNINDLKCFSKEFVLKDQTEEFQLVERCSTPSLDYIMDDYTDLGYMIWKLKLVRGKK